MAYSIVQDGGTRWEWEVDEDGDLCISANGQLVIIIAADGYVDRAKMLRDARRLLPELMFNKTGRIADYDADDVVRRKKAK